MGAFYDNTMVETHTFRSIKYTTVNDFMDWHMDIIRGPGLSYHPDDLLAPTTCTSAESIQQDVGI